MLKFKLSPFILYPTLCDEAWKIKCHNLIETYKFLIIHTNGRNSQRWRDKRYQYRQLVNAIFSEFNIQHSYSTDYMKIIDISNATVVRLLFERLIAKIQLETAYNQ